MQDFSTPPRNSWIPLLCHTVQIYSDTLYPEISQVSQVKGSVLQDCCPKPPVLLRGYRLGAPKTPSLGLINLLEHLTELRETFYFWDCWFIIKGFRNSSMEDELGKVQGKTKELPCPLQLCHSPWISRCPPTWKPSERSPSGFFWRLHYIGTIDEIIQLTLQSLSPFWQIIVSLKVSNLQLHGLPHWQPAPSLSAF